jgi:hypothetical protein
MTNKKLETDLKPKVRMTGKNLREIMRRAEEKYGEALNSMPMDQVIDENPDWIEELELPIELADGQIITSEKSLKGIEAAAEIDAVLKQSRQDFMNRTSESEGDEAPSN